MCSCIQKHLEEWNVKGHLEGWALLTGHGPEALRSSVWPAVFLQLSHLHYIRRSVETEGERFNGWFDGGKRFLLAVYARHGSDAVPGEHERPGAFKSQSNLRGNRSKCCWITEDLPLLTQMPISCHFSLHLPHTLSISPFSSDSSLVKPTQAVEE